ncbi:PKD domain-containing protein [Bermanella sp. WJH001]|uniref:PKD domain-containing protein n=1 Tax=Bermanella sp. WJH001 TaxID=3048005 RepID=UPI0024BEA8B9|nr:PKD domain-containing protein [Bermanella sp. WJH001]MDJ1538571.1 PKD domain-containing protein [Bermanella sp. WJH001]
MKEICILITFLVLAGCGDKKTKQAPQDPVVACDLSQSVVHFEDQDFTVGNIGGEMTVSLPTNCAVNRIEARWLNNQGQPLDELVVSAMVNGSNSLQTITIPFATNIPNDDATLQLHGLNDEHKGQPQLVSIIDLAHVNGPGGNYYSNWMYGDDRPALVVSVRKQGSDYFCVFDNGNVLVHDANFEEDLNDKSGLIVVADDALYPAFEFDCTDSQVNEHRKVMTYDQDDNDIVHTYSMINDAMFYGSLVFDMYEELLGIRPMEKIRIRAHYGSLMSFNLWAHWDGAYVNFNDVMFRAYGSASLDTVSHEITHGVLQQHTALKFAPQTTYHMDGRMLHEAFSDMASVMAHYQLYGELNWVMGDENFASQKRYLNQIETEKGAIASYFDYTDAGTNYYKRMGMMTYPFYVLTQKWGVENTFSLFLKSAQSCWQPNAELMQAVTCVYQTAQGNDFSTTDVVDAFRAVKIQLNEEDTLAHYEFEAQKLRVQFTDDTHSDRVLTEYLWDFDDGVTSTQASPYHEYANSGEYEPTLTVTDHLGVTDTFSRYVSITDEYCRPFTSTVKRQFDSVAINGDVIAFDPSQYDYTDLEPIEVTAGTPFSLVVTGTVVDTEFKDTRWSARVDLNDDGKYTEADGELLLEYDQFENEYGLNQNITIGEEYIGNTVYMRLNGDTFKGFSACHAILGSVIDVRLKLVAP